MPNLMQSPVGPEVTIDGVRYLYFGGSCYLCMQAHPEVVEAGVQGLRSHGLHTGTSRAGFGTCQALLDVERLAALYFGVEDAYYFGSGYVANHVMVSMLGADVDAILIDEAAHFSGQEAARVAGKTVIPFSHGDPRALRKATEPYSRVLVMADAVGPSSGVIAPVAAYLEILSKVPESRLLLDDAHGFGVLGENGRGLLEELGLWKHVNGGVLWNGVELAVCGTLAKALGGFGGVIPGSQAFVTAARQASHYYEGATPQPPAITAASAKALEILISDCERRSRLRRNIAYLREGLFGLGVTVPEGASANFGITVGNGNQMKAVHKALKNQGILLPYIPVYSGISSEGVLRVAVFSEHSTSQLDRLVTALSELI